MRYIKIITIAAIGAVAIVVSAFILGKSIRKIQDDNRYISVKGLSEREAKADLAVWSIKARIAKKTLDETNAGIESANSKILTFLKSNGLNDGEIIARNLIVVDRLSREYGQYNPNIDFRYIATKTIEIRSTNVDLVDKIAKMHDQLLQQGVMIDNENLYESQPRYYFTRLNEVKPLMLEEATQNAHKAAEQFSKESEVSLGKLKQASQGVFSILDRESSLAGNEYGNNNNDIYKKIRVVVSVMYSIQ